MNETQINNLCRPESLPGSSSDPELLETHISWLILTDRYAYKIKKPLTFSFLDFSTPERRKYYCHREIELNKRLTQGIYIDVQPVMEKEKTYRIGSWEGATVLDFAVRMHRIDPSLQMDRVLKKGGGTKKDMHTLAEVMTVFHQEAEIVDDKNIGEIRELYEDLTSISSFLNEAAWPAASDLIDKSISTANRIIEELKDRMQDRLNAGFVRDIHGALHTGNIFLLDSPQPFDCIEYNDGFRQIDVLDELAFLCMDLEYHERPELATAFLKRYLDRFPAMEKPEDDRLFTFYKSYRANVRAKVFGLQAENEADADKQKDLTAVCLKYLTLMNRYLSVLS